MRYFGRTRKAQLFLLLSSIVLVADGFFVLASYYLSSNSLHQELTQESQMLHSTFKVSLQDSLANLRLMGALLANDQRLQELFYWGGRAVIEEGGGAGGNRAATYRQALYRYVLPIWTEAAKQAGMRQFHFHLPPDTSFLRVHAAERFGDDLSAIRRLIADAMQAQAPRSGFEVGRIYAGLRSAVPIFTTTDEQNARQFLGILELGLSFKSVLESFDKSVDAGITVLLSDGIVQSRVWPEELATYFKDARLDCGCFVEASSRSLPVGVLESVSNEITLEEHRGNDGAARLIAIGNSYFSVAFFPLRDYLGEQEQQRQDVGSVVIWKNVSSQVSHFRQTQWFNLAYSLLAFVLLEILLFLGSRHLFHHFESVIGEQHLALQRNERKFRNLVESLSDDYFLYAHDAEGNFYYVSPSVSAVLGYSQAEFQTHYSTYLTNSPINQRVEQFTTAALRGERQPPYELEIYHRNGDIVRLRVSETPMYGEHGQIIGIDGLAHNVTEARRAEHLVEGRESIMESVARDYPLDEILESLVRFSEELEPGVYCAILLLDEQHNCFQMGIAPNLPTHYNRALQGLHIGPHAGSFGMAAYLAERVVVRDILHHPSWSGLRELLLQTDLKACWAEPILTANGKVLGTFVMYYREVREPIERELKLVKWGAELAAIAIERVRAAQALREAEVRLRLLLNSTSEGVFGFDVEGAISFVNPAAAQMLGYRIDELQGAEAHTLIHHSLADGTPLAKSECYMLAAIDAACNQYSAGEVLWRKDGSCFPVEYRSTPMWREQEIIGAVVTFHDISERQKNEQRITHLAFHDALTNLPNRAAFLERLNQCLADYERHQLGFALHFLDLDHFKDVNDTLGHPVGDGLLQTVAKRLQALVRQTDTVARFGGDEFAVLQRGIQQSDDACLLAERIIHALSQPMDVDGHRIHSNASIGVVWYDGVESESQVLMKQADIALYTAKEAGRGVYSLHTPAMTQQVREEIRLTDDLKQALEKHQFSLVYQPQFNLQNGHLVGVEALLRWQHPEQGDISPSLFIPLAEKRGLMRNLGYWVLNAVCEQAKLWQQQDFEFLRIGINISSYQLRDPHFAQTFHDCLQAHGINAQQLEFELQEASLLGRSDAYRQQLQQLADLGVHLSMDDFGAGFSSLLHLKSLGIARLKIDQQFIHDMLEDDSDAEIVRAIIALANALHLAVVAGGVETQAQADFLQELGCNQVQGYWFGKPMSAEALAAQLQAFSKLTTDDKPPRIAH